MEKTSGARGYKIIPEYFCKHVGRNLQELQNVVPPPSVVLRVLVFPYKK